ncbi:uncharacterized protein ANIA_11471 [Aspergillus nidulans FGSC A4]|uniref:Uncharacterized protein n=1 Tax=Emericella nidulans (strain FGSC A4 / ATCC 38163 / CBS 112.46 / NRRL 194 / M139) TaxID=227321 RepID=C8VFA4_EMENI|nr:hypothetical protein [Aspergillus nidulans FGSC A4]CBF81122.1 TPA: hypothetical protein ANIA_11471 [Aspergillus nidulans FGSC A4]
MFRKGKALRSPAMGGYCSLVDASTYPSSSDPSSLSLKLLKAFRRLASMMQR